MAGAEDGSLVCNRNGTLAQPPRFLGDYTMLDNLRTGDRVRVTHHEFPTWIPTNATVISLGIRFPDTPLASRTITVRLDKQPFKTIYLGGVRDLSFSEDDTRIELERIDEPRP